MKILEGDWIEQLRTLPDKIVNCCVTSPPYWGLRNYGHPSQVGLEESPDKYVKKMVAGFGELRRVLTDDGTLWLNLGDSYAGSGKARGGGGAGPSSSKQRTNGGAYFDNPTPIRIDGLKPKDLIGIPWRVAFALQADGWYLRSDIIWHKPNPMPESVTDRPTRSHEYIFLLTKSARYFYDYEAIKEGKQCWRKRGSGRSKHNGDRNDNGDMAHYANLDMENGNRNKRDVWTVVPANFKDAHFATFPPELIKPCILAGCPVGGTVIDPFAGTFTTCAVALEYGRDAIGIELNPDYVKLGRQRCAITPGFQLA